MVLIPVTCDVVAAERRAEQVVELERVVAAPPGGRRVRAAVVELVEVDGLPGAPHEDGHSDGGSHHEQVGHELKVHTASWIRLAAVCRMTCATHSDKKTRYRDSSRMAAI